MSKHLTPERLAEMREDSAITLYWIESQRWPTDDMAARAVNAVPELLDHANELTAALDAATARATQAETRAAELRGQVTSLLEDLANGCVPVKMENGIKSPPYWLGVNSERNKSLLWAQLKCKELGIEWPIKPIPYAGNLPSAAPAPPPSSPAAAPPVLSAGKLAAYGYEEEGPVIEAGKWTGCWFNSACPCNPPDLNECPCYQAPEPDEIGAATTTGEGKSDE